MKKYKESLIKLLNEVKKTISDSSEEDLNKWINEELELSVQFVVRDKAKKKKISEISDIEFEKWLQKLQTFKTREEGIIYLTDTFPRKNILEDFARFIEVPVTGKDKIELLKEKIVEATIGAIIRSKAIQE